jgi:hypothetical protein
MGAGGAWVVSEPGLQIHSVVVVGQGAALAIAYSTDPDQPVLNAHVLVRSLPYAYPEMNGKPMALLDVVMLDGLPPAMAGGYDPGQRVVGVFLHGPYGFDAEPW